MNDDRTTPIPFLAALLAACASCAGATDSASQVEADAAPIIERTPSVEASATGAPAAQVAVPALVASDSRLSLGGGLLAAELGLSEAGEPASKACCDVPEAGVETFVLAANTPTGPSFPDVELIDQHGERVDFYPDLVQGRLVAMNFIFTTCTTICPPLTANFAKLQQMADEVGAEFSLISISVDPVTDTPQRLESWGAKFGAEPGWTFLTGTKRDVDDLLKALGVFTPLKEDHSPIVLAGNDATGTWTRVHGLAPPGKLAEVLKGLASPPAPAEAVAAFEENARARDYFGDVELIDQDGKAHRFYTDLIRGKAVVIDSFFATCTGVCPVLANNLVAVQEAVGDRLEQDVRILSISVDPANDTPEELAAYAKKYGARPGWYFLTGDPENVREALYKLGFAVEQRESHSNVILVGNDRTGLWKKTFGLAKPEEIVPIVEGVLTDEAR